MVEESRSASDPVEPAARAQVAQADMILTLDAQARITRLELSPALQRVFPLPVETFLGHDIGSIYGPEYGERAQALVQSVLSTRRSRHSEERVDVGRQTRWFLVTGLPQAADQVLLVVSDITARKRAERLLHGQNQILEKIARGDTLSSTLDALIRLLEQHGDGFVGSILLLDSAGKRLCFGAAPSLPADYNQAVDGIEIGPQAGSCGTAAYLRQPVFTLDIEASPLWLDYCKLALACGLRACWSTPIFATDGGVLGAFAMYYHERREPSAGDLELVQFALRVASIAIERDRKEQAIRASEKLKSAVLEAALDCIILADAEGKIVEFNPAAETVFGYRREDVVGQNIFELLIPPSKREDQLRMMAAFQSHGPTQRLGHRAETTALRAGGEEFPVELTLAVVEHNGRNIFVCYARDISQRKQADAELAAAMQSLRAANTELQRLNQTKSHFVSTVSHEFRSALTGIRVFSELLSYLDLDSETVRRYAEDIYEDTERLSRMIDDLLDLDRIEAGRMTLNAQVVDLNQLLAEITGMMSRRAVQHTFKLDLDPTLPALTADPDKLIQVITNLLTNAVKYSPAGGDIVVMSRAEKGAAHVQVVDQGVGIPSAALDKVFEPYVRVESDATRYIMGAGLGLPIAQQIVRLHGGNIWAESVEGQGSVFHFTLPLTVASPN